MSTIKSRVIVERDVIVGQFIMLGTLFGLIVLIFGLVIYFDPEARGNAGEERHR